MRLLGRNKFGNDSFSVWFVKPGRIFCYNVKTQHQLLFKEVQGNWECSDYLKGIVSAHSTKPSTNIKETTESKLVEWFPTILQSYQDLCNKYVPQMVRPLREMTYSTYLPNAQHLGLKSNVHTPLSSPYALTWTHCRDTFAHHFRVNLPSVFFCHTSPSPSAKQDYVTARTNSQKVAKFIRKIEEILKLEFISTFYETSCYRIMEIVPSQFWQESAMRKSIFTMFLRCGLGYGFNNINSAIDSYPYGAATKNAVDYFLQGNTKYLHPSSSTSPGWHAVFSGKNLTTVKTLLGKP